MFLPALNICVALSLLWNSNGGGEFLHIGRRNSTMTFPVDLQAMIYMDWSPERKPRVRNSPSRILHGCSILCREIQRIRRQGLGPW
jgi:hypothetical protein